MSEEASAPPPAAPLPSSSRLIIALGGVSMISGLLVVLAFQLTLPIINRNKQEALEKAVFAVLEGSEARKNYQLDENGMTLLPDDSFAEANVFAGYDGQGQLVGLALEGSARGYQDVVKVLYGYSLEKQSIVGVTVLQSSETPGLGDRVETDPAFLENFVQLDARLNEEGSGLANPIVTVKNGKKTDPWQIDGISGATVTSVAIGKALNESANRLLPQIVRGESLLERTIEISKGQE